MTPDPQVNPETIHARIYHQLKTLLHIEDLRGVVLFSTLGRIGQLLEQLDAQRFEGLDLSAPRWRLMLHLFMHEQLGRQNGVTPTELSTFQQVSKNNISSLLRGLEEQGFIVRSMDKDDLRVFRIHLSDTGRLLIMKSAPSRIEGLNRLLVGLTPDEVEQLTSLLQKLCGSLERQSSQCQQKE